MRPTFSVVVPLYRVENYIQDLLDSFSFQDPGDYSIEYIFIDDGSPDRSSEIVERWIGQHSGSATLIRQENQGVSAARNKGMSVARGEWITFPDSDDFLDRGYFDSVANFLKAGGSSKATIIATNIIRYFEKGNRYRNSHALRFKFQDGDALVDLDQNPKFIQLSAPSTFFRLDRLTELNILFNVGLHASEDAIFTSELLLSEKQPILGVVKNARYYYRKRALENSAVDGFKMDPASYLERFEEGYLPVINKALEQRSAVPGWLASLLLYEYRWLFMYETRVATRANILTPEQRRQFIELAQVILAKITAGQVEDYRVTPMQMESRLVLAALAGEQFPNQGVRVADVDVEAKLVRVSYPFTGDLPAEKFLNGSTVLPVKYSKIRQLNYFGQTVLRERIAWVPLSGQLEVQLDGISVPLTYGLPPLKRINLTVQEMKQRFNLGTSESFRKLKTTSKVGSKVPAALKPMGLESSKDVLGRGLRSVKRRVGQKLAVEKKKATTRSTASLRAKLITASSSAEMKNKYGGSWILLDRVDIAGDNAEHVCRYLLKSRPEIKTWFALKRDSKDWTRLEREGFNLLEYGSDEFHAALCLASNLISSHADVEMTEPIPAAAYPNKRRPWKFTFLQHGVTQNDLSDWLNPKGIDLFITTTHAEYEAIAGDNTSYVYSAKETVLTGFPRYDGLMHLLESENNEKKYILVSPTWRHSLVQPKVIGSGGRAAAVGFYESTFYQSWLSFLNDPRTLEVAQRLGLELAFLPHPNMETAMEGIALDPRIRRFSYRQGNVQELFAATGVFVTDYSSVAFDVSFIGAEVHYFQFDREAMFGGGHTMAKGYYDYETHGFGPVHEDIETMLDGNELSIGNVSGSLEEMYNRRIEGTFAFRDALACYRVVAEIEKLHHP